MKFKFLWSIVLLSLMVFSCNEDDINNPTDPVDPNPPVININIDRGNDVTTNLTGSVVDAEGNSLEGVTVKVGNKTTQTNAQGVFLLTYAPMKSKRTVVTFIKDGYFNSIKITSAKENETTYVASKLLKKRKVGEFDNKSGGVISEGESSLFQIKFDANAVQNYTGKVTVFANYINPTAEDFMLRNSGNMEAVNSNSENGALISYGMLHVELQDENGDILQLDKEIGATVSMTVPNELKANAPAEIPLWSFNETEGVWVEEGKGELKNNSYYEGKVSHFSLWNYDKFIGRDDYKCDVQFDIDIENLENESLYVTVEIETTSGNIYKGATYSYADGKFSTCLPTNISSYKIKVYNKSYKDQVCSFLKEFTGTSLSLTSVNQLVLNQSDITEKSLTKFSGTLINCDNENVVRGLIVLTLPEDKGILSEEITNGVFNLNGYICLRENDIKQAEVTVYDLTEGTKSFTKTVDLTDSENITLSACEIVTKVWPGDFDYRNDGQTFFDGEYTEIAGNATIEYAVIPTRETRMFSDVNLIQRLTKVNKSLNISITRNNTIDYSGLENLKSANELTLNGNVQNINFKKLSNLGSISTRVNNLGDGQSTTYRIENVSFPKLVRLNNFSVMTIFYDLIDVPVFIDEASFSFPELTSINSISISENSDRDGDGQPVSLAFFNNVNSIKSFSMYRIGNTDLKGLENAKIEKIFLNGNSNLTDFCAISQETINTITSEDYMVSYNNYNPTLQDLKDGKCKQ